MYEYIKRQLSTQWYSYVPEVPEGKYPIAGLADCFAADMYFMWCRSPRKLPALNVKPGPYTYNIATDGTISEYLINVAKKYATKDSNLKFESKWEERRSSKLKSNYTAGLFNYVKAIRKTRRKSTRTVYHGYQAAYAATNVKMAPILFLWK